MNHIATLKTQARKLRLSTLAQNVELRLQEAQSNQLPHAQFLEHTLQDELNGRESKAIARDMKLASFRDQRSLSDFDFSFNPSIPRSRIYELATCEFIKAARDVLLIGPPGVGKSHLAQSLGREAVRRGHKVYYRSIFDLVRELSSIGKDSQAEQIILNRYLKPELLIIDDMGMKALPPHGAEVLLEIIVRRNELRSTLMTSNRSVSTWAELLGDLPAAGAILDRLLHRAEIISIEGRSHRLAQASAPRESRITREAQAATEAQTKAASEHRTTASTEAKSMDPNAAIASTQASPPSSATRSPTP